MSYAFHINGKHFRALNLKEKLTYTEQLEMMFRLFGFEKVRIDSLHAYKEEQFINPSFADYQTDAEFDYSLLANGTYQIEELTDNEEVQALLRNGLELYQKSIGENDIKKVKFDLLIEEIEIKLRNERFGFISRSVAKHSGIPLLLIFDNQQANKYRKSILERAKIRLTESFSSYRSYHLKDVKTKIKATKDFLIEYRKIENRDEALKFIFWALLGASVDQTDYDETISQIADFSYLLGIDNQSLRDIVQVIKMILQGNNQEYVFQTDEINAIFSKLIVN